MSTNLSSTYFNYRTLRGITLLLATVIPGMAQIPASIFKDLQTPAQKSELEHLHRDAGTFDLSNRNGENNMSMPMGREDSGRDQSVFVLQPALTRGTASMDELTHPLKGDALHMILMAEKDLRANETQKAFRILEKAVDNAEARPFALVILGEQHLKEGMRDPKALQLAVIELQEATYLLPSHAPTRSNLGLAFMLQGQNARALEEAQKALQLDPTQAKTRYVLGQVLLKLGRPEEAVYHLKMAAPELDVANKLLAFINANKAPTSKTDTVRTQGSAVGKTSLDAPAPQPAGQLAYIGGNK